MNIASCPKCKSILKKRYYRTFGWLLIIAILLLQPITIFFFKTVTPLLDIICIGIGLYLIFKKDRCFYYCKKCIAKYSQKDIADLL